jgi:hypothetical protein
MTSGEPAQWSFIGIIEPRERIAGLSLLEGVIRHEVLSAAAKGSNEPEAD